MEKKCIVILGMKIKKCRTAQINKIIIITMRFDYNVLNKLLLFYSLNYYNLSL
jgi:hypothetical protein